MFLAVSFAEHTQSLQCHWGKLQVGHANPLLLLGLEKLVLYALVS